jgi:hypothetical protein
MEDKELEKLIEQLRNNGTSIGIITKTATDEIMEIVQSGKIPEGCPSIASLTDMVLGHVMENLDSANHTMESLNAYLWKHYNHK